MDQRLIFQACCMTNSPLLFSSRLHISQSQWFFMTEWGYEKLNSVKIMIFFSIHILKTRISVKFYAEGAANNWLLVLTSNYHVKVHKSSLQLAIDK